MQNQSKSFSMNCGGQLYRLDSPKIMGILNLTPDSFSDGGQFYSEKNALQQVEKMVREGADIIDVGAQSTRPNADCLSPAIEIQRLGTIIQQIKKEFPKVLVSLDSFYASVVRFAADQGLDLVNDISGGQFDKELLKTVAQLQLPYVLMHVHPQYSEMHRKNTEKDIVEEMNYYFSEKINFLYQLGIKDIILDPGIGFGKTIAQNHQILDELSWLNFGQLPLLVGISRKSFIYKPLGKKPNEIVNETQILHLKALRNGAKILRVHDVAETKETLDIFLQENF